MTPLTTLWYVHSMATKALRRDREASSVTDQDNTTPQLNTRQWLFVDAYVLSPNATQAAIRAGYSNPPGKTAQVQGSVLLSNPIIAREIALRRADLAEEADITRLRVVRGLLKVADNPLAQDSARAESWKHIAKMLGYYVERSESVNVTRHVYSRLNKYTDDQLDAIVEAAPGPRALPPGTPIGGGPGTGKDTKDPALSEPQP